jgi:hypothetical protein
MGVYLSGLVLVFLVIALVDTGLYPLVPDPNVRLATLGLVAGIVFAIGLGLEKAKVLGITTLAAVLATLTSGIYAVTLTADGPGPCSFEYVNRGFPLAWDSTFSITGSPCILLRYGAVNPPRDVIFFFLDMVFYVAAGLAIIQLFRATTGRTTIPSVFPNSIEWQGQPPTNKIRSKRKWPSRGRSALGSLPSSVRSALSLVQIRATRVLNKEEGAPSNPDLLPWC